MTVADLALEIQAERYTHSNESLEALNRRMARERPESPYQVMNRKTRELRAAQAAEMRRVAALNITRRNT